MVGLADENGFPRRGKIESVGTRFDPNTGTLRCRAVVSNPDGILLPGLSARVRLITSAPYKALLVTEGAILSDRGQTYLYVVSERGVVERRVVKVGQSNDDLRVVYEGLKSDEWIVVDSLRRVKPGMTIHPEKIAMPAQPGDTRYR